MFALFILKLWRVVAMMKFLSPIYPLTALAIGINFIDQGNSPTMVVYLPSQTAEQILGDWLKRECPDFSEDILFFDSFADLA